jgi:hypothetical protein
VLRVQDGESDEEASNIGVCVRCSVVVVDFDQLSERDRSIVEL